MTKSFVSFALTADHVAVVFPLVQTALPGMTLEAWRRFARCLVDGSAGPLARGALGLRNAAGYVCGLLIFRVDHDLRHGKVLAVDLFIALDLLNEEEAGSALLQAVEAKARELQCTATHIRLDAGQKSLPRRLLRSGHCKEAELFCKMIEAAPLPS